MSILVGSVGRGGNNQAGDARLVQHLLNDAIGHAGGVLLTVDGVVGPKTIAAIEQYQRGKGLVSDGRVDPTGATIKSLANDHLAGLASGVINALLPPTQQPAVPPAVVSAALATYWDKLKKA